jgi:phosphatidylserine decarboxylase
MSPGQRLFVALQYALPQHLLSGLVFRLTRLRLGPLTALIIRAFSRLFRVDLSEAAETDPRAYPTFNAFFTRALRPKARPLAQTGTLASPVDGTVSQLGRIGGCRLIQAKGRDYSLAELLGGDAKLATRFVDGSFATLYLSPRDYHRIHMPVDGRLLETIHIPGRLFSVNPTTTAAVPRLFARNERVIALFDTDLGPLAMVLVGAIFVGSIETVFGGLHTPPRGRSITRIDYRAQDIRLGRGDEMGRFNMGSTVILVLADGAVAWHPDLGPGSPLRCRGDIGRLRP